MTLTAALRLSGQRPSPSRGSHLLVLHWQVLSKGLGPAGTQPPLNHVDHPSMYCYPCSKSGQHSCQTFLPLRGGILISLSWRGNTWPGVSTESSQQAQGLQEGPGFLSPGTFFPLSPWPCPPGNNGWRGIEVGQARAPPAPLAFSGPGVAQGPLPAGPHAQ